MPALQLGEQRHGVRGAVRRDAEMPGQERAGAAEERVRLLLGRKQARRDLDEPVAERRQRHGAAATVERRAPWASSSARTWAEIVGWLTCPARAALVKLPACATR